MLLRDALAVEKETSSGLYLDTLTGARAVAVMWVFVLHIWKFAGEGALPVTTPFGVWFDLQHFVAQGEWGVRLFFALSGFLLSLPYLTRESKKKTFWNNTATFYERRALRILPGYYAILLVLLITGVLGLTTLPSASLMFGHTAFINFWWMEPALLGVFWTLPVEITFYLLFPWLVKLLKPRSWWVLLIGCILAAFISRFLMRHYALNGHEWVWGFGSSFAAQMEFFIFGMLAALCFVRIKPSPRTGDLCMIFGALLMALMVWATGPRVMDLIHWYGSIHYAFYVPSALAIAVFVFGAAAGGPLARALLANRVMMFIGTISFSLYLWHTFFMLLITFDPRHFGEPSTWRSVAIASLFVLPPTLMAAYASYRWVELPFLKIRHHAQGTHAGWFSRHPMLTLALAAATLVFLTGIANLTVHLALPLK